MSRVLVVTNDYVNRSMAGPGIRALELCRQLHRAGSEVTLATLADTDLPPQGFEIASYAGGGLEAMANGRDVILVQGFVLGHYPFLRRPDSVLVVDLYDPFPLENLVLGAEFPRALACLDEQIRRGDYFLCASERQRDYWLGALTALNRVNPQTYYSDPSLRDLIGVVPFGIPDQPPLRRGPGLRGVLPGVGKEDFVLLWGGGLYDWLDPLTLIKAVARLAPSMSRLRLVFMSARHPNPDVPKMPIVERARELAAELGVLGTGVIFNEDWVEYERRADWLLEADVGVSTHPDHLETRFSFRTRLLDYVWAGLPMITTGGDQLSQEIDAKGLGITVPAGDVGALARAIEELATDQKRRLACAKRVRAYAAGLTWATAAEPLVRFCASPRRAPDLLAVAPREAVPLPVAPEPVPAPARKRKGRRAPLPLRVCMVLLREGPGGIWRRLGARGRS